MNELRILYKNLFNTEEGKRILEDLEARYAIHGTTFSPDSTETAYREGQRTVVLFIKSMLRDQPKIEEQIET
tara:strand:+ start:71 stop:286 length:216 start_codon:yes stop_codon:yes gene_type:complete